MNAGNCTVPLVTVPRKDADMVCNMGRPATKGRCACVQPICKLTRTVGPEAEDIELRTHQLARSQSCSCSTDLV